MLRKVFLIGSGLVTKLCVPLGVDVVPIPGTTQIGHLSDNMAARALTLSREDLEEIASAVPTEHVSGERYHKPTDWFVGQMEKRRKTEEEPEPEQQVPGT